MFEGISQVSGRASGMLAVLGFFLILPSQIQAGEQMAAQSGEILSHRAVYKLSLDSAKPRSQVTGAPGKMSVEIVGDCGGWSSSQNLDLNLQTADGSDVNTVTQFASWESRDGLSYRFNIRVTQNGKLIEQFNGQALRKKKEGTVEVTYLSPKPLNITHDSDTVFPIAHLKELLAAVRDKKKVIVRTVFDGATQEGAFHINAVIGAAVSSKGAQKELGDSYWPIHLAFFSLAKEADLPEYETTIHLVENGVVREFLIDYGDFAIRAALDKIEALPRPSC